MVVVEHRHLSHGAGNTRASSDFLAVAVHWELCRESSHAPDLHTYAAAEGHVTTVGGYLTHRVLLEAKNYEGSTAAFTAAAGGSVPGSPGAAGGGEPFDRAKGDRETRASAVTVGVIPTIA